MSDTPSRSNTIPVDAERLERIRDVLAMISLGEFDPDVHLTGPRHQDAFSSFEETIDLFARQLHATVRENEESMRRLATARTDLEEKLATIERQREAIRDLSTPVLELWEDVLTLPIVGELDGRRAREMTDDLLQHIARRRARCVIIDVTGVAVVDTATADVLIRMVSAARMLGAVCILTGISPSVAETLSHIGVELRGVKTRGTLRDGLEECFRYLRATAATTDRLRSTRIHPNPSRG